MERLWISAFTRQDAVGVSSADVFAHDSVKVTYKDSGEPKTAYMI
jgi:hypothetical protein